MEKVTIRNLQGESGIVNVVRYFQKDSQQYLIYSLNEVDEAGFTRLYVAKLNGTDGTYNAETLTDEEWTDIKNLVKVIVKANKEGLPIPVQDLNPKKLQNITLKDKKIFKLNAPLVEDLAKNTPSFNDEPAQTNNQIPGMPQFDVPTESAFSVPVQPSFDYQDKADNTVYSNSQPEIPSFNMPQFDTSIQPTFDAEPSPVQNNFDFGAVNQPQFNTPNVPTFDINQAPVQNNFDFGAVNQPQFDIPNMPTFDINQAPVQNNFDFKTDNQAYNNGFSSNGVENKDNSQSIIELQNQIDRLTEEVNRYKNIIDKIKNTIEE